ncbi:hypothetical protein POKO110462_06080 [Pontibacter korlensis]|uniref:Lipoprotein n=1 Tax=Pontibacter korlensis TaxID=400092 RepID=A0A0E3UWL8_9BACT|nr:hypothetical protein [Pontibacter korlensis]AKD03502.1 hypothetical protein PKOR_10645 [Pontibacter korlensis]
MRAASAILTLAFSVLAFSGCSKEDEPEITSQWVNNTERLLLLNQDKVTITEGVAGTLTLIEGNCMPIIDENSTCKEYPVKRSIKIYPYTTIQDVEQHDQKYYTINARPILTVSSDAEGFYQAKLPAGTYSVFVVEDGKLYANGIDGQGGINPVLVEPNKVSNFNLRLDYAVY